MNGNGGWGITDLGHSAEPIYKYDSDACNVVDNEFDLKGLTSSMSRARKITERCAASSIFPARTRRSVAVEVAFTSLRFGDWRNFTNTNTKLTLNYSLRALMRYWQE